MTEREKHIFLLGINLAYRAAKDKACGGYECCSYGVCKQIEGMDIKIRTTENIDRNNKLQEECMNTFYYLFKQNG